MTVYDRWLVVKPLDGDTGTTWGQVQATKFVPHDEPPEWEPWVQNGLRNDGWRVVRQENFTDLTGMVESEHVPDWRGSAQALAEVGQRIIDAINAPAAHEQIDEKAWDATVVDLEAALDRFRTTLMEESLAAESEREDGEDEPGDG